MVRGGVEFYNEDIKHSKSRLNFTETAIFRNGTPVAQAGFEFKLTEASENTYGAQLSKGSHPSCNLGGREKEHALHVKIPGSLKLNKFKSVDICLILKEHPTIAIDFTAYFKSNDSVIDSLKAICKSIMVNGNHIGEQIFADVITNEKTGEFEIFVTKPYLEKGLFTIHFA